MKGLKKMLFISAQIVLALIFAVYIIRYFTNAKLPYVTNDRTALIGLLIVGFVICCAGILFNLPKLNWANVWVILAAILGTVLMIIMIAVIFKLTKFDNYKMLFYITAAGILIKMIITTIHHI